MKSTKNQRCVTVLQVTGLGACALSLAACGLFARAPVESPQPAPTLAAPTPSSAAPVSDPEDVAIRVMKLFARPDTPERRWFIDLLPYLTEDYADQAQYIDPARVPFNRVTPNPSTRQDEHLPQLVTVRFETNDGPWQVVLVQEKAGEPWLVEAIEPDDPAPAFTP